ncbi:MAG: PKD domain-containing protein, partial [Saprospiraceae bacterium]|nr:PKD domain-containing protein [Saprospiraceae bacterium]
MDLPLLHKIRVFCLVLFFLASPKAAETLFAQWDPTWFTCDAVSVTNCNSSTPSFFIDLSNDPDRKWYSCKISRGSQLDTCCNQDPASNNERCIEFKVLLHPETQAILFEIPESSEPEWQDDSNHPSAPGSPGAKPSVNTYRINCGPLQGGAQGSEPACLTSAVLADTVFITYCQPGGNDNVYRIKSIKGNIGSGNLIIQQGACGGDVSVSTNNLDLSTITWNSTQDPSYNSFLSSLTDTMVTVTVPNGADLSNARYVAGIPYLDYEVCGYPIGWNICTGLDSVCGIASIAIITPPSITASDVSVCPENPYYVEVTHANPSIFEYWWYDGPNGTGTQFTNGTNDWNWTYATAGTKSVVFRDPTVAGLGLDPDCTRDTVNITIILFATPPASINDPGLICSPDPISGGIDYNFTTPNAGAGASYFWEFFENPPGASFATSTQREPTVTFNTCGDKFVRLTVTSIDLCDSIVTRVLQADSLPPDLSGCVLPEPTVECGGTAQNEANITAWHNANLALLQDINGCVIEDCGWAVTSDFNLGNFTPGPCGSGSLAGSITVEYTVDDGCFTNMINATYTIVDNTPPVVDVGALPNLSFECVGAIPPPDTNITIIEVCGTASRVWLGDSPSGPPCNITILRTYRLTDACGNINDTIQTFTISDVTAPIITCNPATITLEGCDLSRLALDPLVGFLEFSTTLRIIDSATFVPLWGTVSDNCGIDSIYYTDVQSGSCPIVVTRTFTVVDSCGFSDMCTATIHVDDTTIPEITPPDPINVEGCTIGDIPGVSGLPYSSDTSIITEATYLALDPGVATLFDSCGILQVKYIDALVADSCQYGIVRTFIAEDLCLNRALTTQNITIQDLTNPTITCPDDIVTDGCSTADIITVSGLAYSTSAVQISTATFLALPSTIVAPDVADNCGISYITYQDVITNASCPLIVERTFTVVDSCDLTASCVQTIELQDNTVPSITCPIPVYSFEGCDQLDLFAETGYGFSSSWTTMTSAQYIAYDASTNVSDNCGFVSVEYIDQVINIRCPTTVERTFRAVDPCGNISITCLQTFTIDDTTPPVITCPADVDIECFEDIPNPHSSFGAFTGAGGIITDCQIDQSTFMHVRDSVTGGGTTCAVIYRFYSVADSCGNVDSCFQIITV